MKIEITNLDTANNPSILHSVNATININGILVTIYSEKFISYCECEEVLVFEDHNQWVKSIDVGMTKVSCAETLHEIETLYDSLGFEFTKVIDNLDMTEAMLESLPTQKIIKTLIAMAKIK